MQRSHSLPIRKSFAALLLVGGLAASAAFGQDPLPGFSLRPPASEDNPLRIADLPAVEPVAPPPAEPIAPEPPSSTTEERAAAAEANTEPVPAPAAVSSETVQRALDEVNADMDLADDQKKKLVTQLSAALASFEAAAKARQRTKGLEAETTSAPTAIAGARKQLDQPIPEPTVPVSTANALDQLSKHLETIEAEQRKAQQELDEATALADAKAQADRKAEISKLLETAKAQLEETKQQLAAPPEGLTPRQAFAHRAEHTARELALQANIAALQAEQARNSAMSELYTIRRDYAARRVGWFKKAVTAWRKAVADQRKIETERQAAEARRKVREALPPLKQFAERNAELAKRRSEVATSLETTVADLESTNQTLEQLQSDFETVTDKVEVGGMTVSAGLLLRERRQRLPRPDRYSRQMRQCVGDMQGVSLALLDLEEERNQFSDLDDQHERLMSAVASARSTDPAVNVSAMVRELLEHRRQYLDDLITDSKAWHDRLSDLELASRSLLQQRGDYLAYIDENVLWIRSSEPLGVGHVRESVAAVAAVGDVDAWKQGGLDLVGDLRSRPWLSGLFAIAVIALLLLRSRMSARLRAVGTDRRARRSVLPMLEATGLTAAIAFVWPAAIWFLGWRLEAAGSLSAWIAIGQALQITAIVYGSAAMVRQICRGGGLGEKHFHWNPQLVRVLRQRLSLLMLLGCPIVFLVTVTQVYQDGQWRDSLGRMMFICGLLLLAATSHFLLRGRGAVAALMAQTSSRWISRLRPLLYTAGAGVPVVLVVLSVLGYSYTAGEIIQRLGQTLWLTTAMLVGWAILSRACHIVWQRIALVRRAQRHEEALASEQEISREVLEQEAEEDQQLGRQLQVCLRSAALIGLAVTAVMIWSSMFPALGIVNRVELWSTTSQVQQTVAGADGETTVEEVTRRVPVTLGHVLICLAIIGGTVVISRNVPGLLELVVLSRLPLDAGGRHAITLIARYAMTMFGVVFAFHVIGVTWSSVQWLVAAMTVGLGFGLQEIFANLVSGIIILLERPVRIGDHVTVSGTTGVITRMQIRATTITDYDNRELIVPNKKFITEEVVNWTLSNPITRMVLKVGISYSCEAARASELLLKVAREHPLVLDTPEPSALFVGFGDSTKDQELRVFISSRRDYPEVLHSLHLAIERAFKEADIEIAFPQQDLHIRSVEGITIGKTDAPPAKAA